MSAYTAANAEWCQPAMGGYITLAPLAWDVGRKDSGLTVIVPRDWFFDVSVPIALQWAFCPHDARYLKAAALHDWLLDDGWGRVAAGAVFHDALIADGVGRARRLAMWLAVSLWRWD